MGPWQNRRLVLMLIGALVLFDNTEQQAASTFPPTPMMPTTPTTPTPTVPPVTCTEFEIQLGNAVHSVMEDPMTGISRFSVSGTVEICLGGSFLSICDEGWGQEEAQVACNALNYPSTSYQAFPLIGLNTTRQVIAENVMCHDGNETSARQCNFTAPPVSPRCYANSSAAGVECIQVRTSCINEGEITLLDPEYEGYLNIFTGDQVNVTGRVGVCRNGSYDGVCDVNWDANNAAVLCRTIIPQSTAIPVKGLSGGRAPVVLEDVRCFGNESNIANCSTSPIGQISNPVCLQPNRTAGVKCSTTDDYCVDGTLRLVDGPTFYEGRVEVCRNSQWLSVCDVGVNSTLATNVCERRFHLGANATAIHGSAYGPGMGSQLAFCEVYPSVTDIVPVENCTSNPGLQDLCSHNRDLGVRCQPGLLALSINADEVPTLGSTSFALECFGRELPWEARLVSVGWYKSGTQLSPNDSVSIEILRDGYYPIPSAFNPTYIFSGQATFNRPLTISDGGEYSCNVSILLTYPDESTHLLTNSTTYILGISVPPPTVTVTTNGTPNAGSRFEVNCFAELPSSDLAPYTTVDYFDDTFHNLSERLEETPDARIQLLPTRQYNATHLVRTIILYPLSRDHQDSVYYCVANITTPHTAPSVGGLRISFEVFSNGTGGDTRIPPSFLPFGSDYGDLTVPVDDDGSSDEISLETDVVIFRSRHNQLYVNTNGVLSFGIPYTRRIGTNFNFLSSPPIIAPFWDNVDITRGGTIYYRQDSNSTIIEMVQQAVASEHPEAASFQPSLVFVATWDRVESYRFDERGFVNTFQVVVASDGTRTFVRFSYGDIQWGGHTTVIGVSAGDRINFVTHPASHTSSALLLYNTTTTYTFRSRIDANDTLIPQSFLPFGPDHGDLTVPVVDDGSTNRILLGTDVVIFGFRHNQLYVNTNGVLSFGRSYTRAVSTNFNSLSSPPIIVPFWDDINIVRGGTIYYRQDSNSTITELVQQAVASEYPEATSFQPSLVFVATWDRVEPFRSSDRGRMNTFQVVVASNGTWTFVKFSYGDIQWGGNTTVIGVTAGDQVNFITHPASQSTAVLMLYNTTTTYTYRFNESTTTMSPTTTLPTTTTPSISDRQIPQSFLPFGPDHGDLTAPVNDDGSTNGILLGTDVIIFGSRHNQLYVNTNGVLSFGTSHTSPVVTNFTLLSSPPIIAPFWDDIDITRGGTIYYRQDSNSTITELVQKAVASEYPEAASFQPSLVFVATWDRVEPWRSSNRGRVNTFQVVIASDGTRTFIRFSYGDIQWGGNTTVIGVTAGDRINFVIHPASQTSSALLLYNTTATYMYRIDENVTVTGIPLSFLPFGSDHGDLTAPVVDDGSTDEIILGTDVVIFGSRHDRLYVNTNGVLSFGTRFTRPVGTNFNFLSSPPIIVPFWDDINIVRGGTIYYRQDSNSTIMELVQQAVASEYPEAASFQPSLVFVATWDRVEPWRSSDRGRVNTFQVVVASDGTWTFVRFSYGDIQWGGNTTVIGVGAGDQINFIIHPASQSMAVLMLYNTTTTYMYRVNESTTTIFPTTTTPPPPECSIQGEILPYLNETSHRGLRSFQGTFEICIGGLYGSVCDIGWNQSAAQTLCRDLYGSEYIAEPLYELGHPPRRYVAQHFNCSASTDGLESCNYNSLVDTQCFVGPHVAGVRCTERAPPPIGVQGMCSVIVWYSPAVQSCEDIRGYEVRLYIPQLPRLNVTNCVGANGTFYIVDVDKLVSREETYVQVRAIHSIGVGEWTEGTSLGCEKPEMPTITTEMPPRVYFELNGKTYHNNSAVAVSEIGEGTSALYCRTDKEECCGTVPNRFGQFYYPNGVQVPINARGQGFYRNRGSQLIRLNRREGIMSPTGTYRCEIPNADDETVKIYITLTE